LLPVTILPSKRCCETLSIFVFLAATCNSATTVNRRQCCVHTAKWFREEATVLRDSYCACLVILSCLIKMRNFCDMPMKITCLATNLKIVCFKGFTLACSVFSLLGKLTLKTHQQCPCVTYHVT